MLRPTQPQFKIRLWLTGKPSSSDAVRKVEKSRNSSADFVDIEPFVDYDVVYEEQATMLNTLSFTITKDGDLFLQKLHLNMWVSLYGGTYSDGVSDTLRLVFSGTIIRIRTKFNNNGKIFVSCEAISYGYVRLGKDRRQCCFPDKRSDRSFLTGKTEIKLSEVVRGIVEESGMKMGDLILGKGATDIVFTEKNTRRQNNMSDWAFLHELARISNCTMWLEYSTGDEVVHFVDKGTALKTANKEISFVWYNSGSAIGKDKNGNAVSYRTSTIEEQSEWLRYPGAPEWDRPRFIWDVDVDEDIASAYAVTRAAVYIDKETGEQKEAIAEVEERDGKRFYVFYELDERRVQETEEKHPEFADKVRKGDPTGMTWADGQTPEQDTYRCARFYYKKVERYDEEQMVFDTAFFGIKVTGKTIQDLNIHSQQTYPIRGIMRYSSSDVVGNWYLLGLRHTWNREGALTELEFIK